MKLLALFYFSPILLLSLVESCCEQPSSDLKRKWELWTHPFLRKRAVEIAQKRLLNILGLDNFPNPGRHVIPHKFMLEIYRNLSSGNYKGDNNSDALPNAVVGIVDQERFDNSVTRTSQQVFYFNVSNVPSSHTILDAQLRVLRLPTTIKEKSFTERHGTTYRAKLYGKRITEFPNLAPFASSNLELLDSFAFDISDISAEHWNVFSVKKSVEKSQRAKAKLQVLELRVESVTSGELVPPEQVGFSKAGRLHNKHALLVVFTSDGKSSQPIRKPVSNENKDTSNAISRAKNTKIPKEDNSELEHTRVRRDTRSKSGGNNKKNRRGTKSKRRRKKDSCRRKPLYVDFNQLGWSNWVIAPRGYGAYFCQGLCEFPIDNHLKPTNHATVQTILNSVAPSLAPQACCSPNKFSAISILFVDTNENIIYKKYEDMVVERCGCK